MSNPIMNLCWPLRMKPTPKSVLMALADRADDEGYCFPSIETLCGWTCFGRDAVIEAIAWLEQAGAILANRENGRRTTYTVTPQNFDASVAHVSRRATSRANRPQPVGQNDGDQSGRTTAPVGQTDGCESGISTPPVGQTDGYQSCSPTPPVGQTNRSGKTEDQSGKTEDQSGSPTRPVGQPDTIPQEPPMIPKRTPKGRASSFDAKTMAVPEWLDADLWSRWAIDRAKRGKPITEEAARLQVQKLQELLAQGFSPASVIEPSIERGWTGLFAPSRPAAQGPRRPTSHHGLASKNYSEGITQDGSFA